MEENVGKCESENEGARARLRGEERPAKGKPEARSGGNSWDSSSSSKARGRVRSNEWDSGSECQVTMVEPFEAGQECGEDWDSESEKKAASGGGRGWRASRDSGSESSRFNLENLSDIEKSSLMEEFDGSTGKGRGGEGRNGSVDVLLVEDLEEFSRNEEERQSPRANDPESKVLSNPSEGTPEDTTVWMIPISGRSQSADSTSKLISSSDGEFQIFVKKCKSFSDVGKSKKGERNSARFSRSICLGLSQPRRSKVSLPECEGPGTQTKLEMNPKGSKEEYECRPMTISKDNPDKASLSSRRIFNREEASAPTEDQAENPDYRSRSGEEEMSEGTLAGPSSAGTMDVVSLPDMIGRNSFKEREDKCGRRVPHGKGKKDGPGPAVESESGESRVRDSWVLLDETGQYQPVTPNEVSFLLNGRSADAVLQGRKEHFIPNPSPAGSASPVGSFSGILTKESLQHLLMIEDVGGEREGKKSIDLERKMENTLLYIHPGMNRTASVRIIPVDTETLNLWRRTKDTGSILSSEVDLRLFSPQDSVETTYQRHLSDHHSAPPRRAVMESSLLEQDESTGSTDPQMQQAADYPRLLMETRMIVDNLATSFNALQTRLDGETSRSLVLQGEINKLRHVLKSMSGKVFDRNSRETINEGSPFQATVESSTSILTVKPSDKTDIRSESIIEEPSEETFEDASPSRQGHIEESAPKKEAVNDENLSNNVTVNIYTVEDVPEGCPYLRPQDSNTLIQFNLRMIEGKMQRLQEENEAIKRQNQELRRKLKEISQELEKYLCNTSESEVCIEESRELEALRDQVCNLKLELDSLKRSTRSQGQALVAENSLMQEDYTKTLFSLEEWCTTAAGVFREIQEAQSKLQETGIVLELNLEAEAIKNPRAVSNFLSCYVRQSTQCLLTAKNENFLYEQTLQEELRGAADPKETSGLRHVLSCYCALMDECRRGQGSGDGNNKILDDYFAVIVEKASLIEEIKTLKTENEILRESQVQHHEKLKQTMIALKDRKTEVTALESSQRLSEEEKVKMAGVLELYEEERKSLEVDKCAQEERIQSLMTEIKRKELELSGCNERLQAAADEVRSFQNSCRLKDELIEELKMENDRLLVADRIKSNQMEMLKDEIKALQTQVARLESELTSTKLFLGESQKEMTAYVNHLESIINSSQESLDKTKQKLKESNQTVSRLKSEIDVFDKQHQCDLKLYNRTKDELESCKEELLSLRNVLKEAEEERGKVHKSVEVLAESEREKSEALELLGREYEKVVEANSSLRQKVEAFSKDKDESLKEHKDLVNKYAMLSREVQKLQDKYRSVKAECNERTDLIRYLETLLKDNLLEYNNRIACLEQNISKIIEKIMACKNCMREKNAGADVEVRELRHQLDVTYRERQELEDVVDKYYSLMKRLKSEIREKEEQVEELHARLFLERKKAAGCEDGGKRCRNRPETPEQRSEPCGTVEELESQLERTKKELEDRGKELSRTRADHEKEKKKLELAIADLKSEISRYQLRIEVMMRNLSGCNSGLSIDKRNAENGNLQSLRKELEEKEKKIGELSETIHRLKVEMTTKESDLPRSQKKNLSAGEELQTLNDALSAKCKSSDTERKERDEMAEKLLQSIKLIMEERSARQTSEILALEKEKNLKNQIDQVKNELALKVKECQTLSCVIEDKNKIVNKLEKDLKKMKSELLSLNTQVSAYKRTERVEKRESCDKEQTHSKSLSDFPQDISTKRLESCLKELKEVRDTNLQLRKMEGQCQARIVALEDELRDARLLVKELEGDIKTEKKSKKAFKNMLIMTKMEIEKCLLAKQVSTSVADRISRHLDLLEVPSRELLSGFRLNGTIPSPKTYNF